jgi:hypothetical protein
MEHIMGRVINTANPGTERNRWRRTVAEALRHLMGKRDLDAEAKDLAALIVLGLRGIADTIDVTTEAWEKRDYYVKADRFRLDWEWAGLAADKMTKTIKSGQWQELPPQLAGLLPHFADIRITKMTRTADSWAGCYEALMRK